MRKLIFWSCLLYGSFALAQDYLWPTDASQWMTSAFGEFRPRRFHAAIDIKTWNRTGYRVFAVRDGYIYRIRVSPRGYGKAIYLKLDTGELVVYAHLERFNDRLEEIVWREQQRRLRYRVDRYFKAGEIPVKKGDLLGYTGETGIGVPHLHFELRDQSNRPINPLLKGFRIDDRVPPIPRQVAIIPLKPGSRVQDHFKPHLVSLRRIGEGRYAFDEISAEGEIGLAVSAYDRSGTVHNRFGVYEIRLLVDGEEHFAVKYDRFNYAHNRFIELDRDYRLYRRNKGLFHRLFLDPENRLKFYRYRGEEKGRIISGPVKPGLSGRMIPTANTNGNNDPYRPAAEGAGGYVWDQNRIIFTPGRHQIEIVLRDFFNNETRITGTLRLGRRFRIYPYFEKQDTAVVLERIDYEENHGIVNLDVQGLRAQQSRKLRWVPIQTIDADEADLISTQFSVLPLAMIKEFSLLKLIATDAMGIQSWPDFIPVPGGPSHGRSGPLKANLELDFFDDYLALDVRASRPMIRPPVVEVALADGSTRYPLTYPVTPTHYILSIPLAELAGRRVTISAQIEDIRRTMARASLTFDNIHIRKGQKRVIFSQDSLLKVSFWNTSLYRDLFLRIIQEPANAYGRDENLIGKIYTVEPKDVPLNRGAMIALRYPDGFPAPEKLGVYYRHKNRWTFIDHKLDRESRTVSALVLSFETFALRQDIDPPVVALRRPKKGQSVSSRGPIILYARDEQSGFESEESLELYIDGRKVVAEYDPENDILVYRPRPPLNPGAHQLRFKATDRNGNVSTLKTTFWVQ